MKPGDKLTAIDPCVMENTGEHALIVGKQYKICAIDNEQIFIQSELFGDHKFPLDCIHEFFDVESITEPALFELGFGRVDWYDGDASFEKKSEWVKKISGSKLKVDTGFEVHILMTMRFRALPNCKTLTDLKTLIRLLGV